LSKQTSDFVCGSE